MDDSSKDVLHKIGYMALGFIVLVIGLIYYFNDRPYEIQTKSLTITAAFPKPPIAKKVSLSITPTYTTSSLEYTLKRSDATYTVSITNIDSSYLQQSGYVKVMSQFLTAIGKAGGYSGYGQEIKLDQLLGQTIMMQSKSGVMHGKFFLTSGGMVAIYVEVPDLVMTQDGLWFIQSLSITQRSNGLG